MSQLAGAGAGPRNDWKNVLLPDKAMVPPLALMINNREPMNARVAPGSYQPPAP